MNWEDARALLAIGRAGSLRDAAERVGSSAAAERMVARHEARHVAAVRAVIERIVALVAEHATLFAGERPGAY